MFQPNPSRSFRFAVIPALGLCLCMALMKMTAHSPGRHLEGVEATLRCRFPALKEALAPCAKFRVETRVIGGRRIEGLVPESGIALPAGLKPEEAEAWLALARKCKAREGGVTPFFPASSRDPQIVEANGIQAAVRPVAGKSVPAMLEGGKVVYHEAYPHTDSLHAVSSGRCEEFLLLRSPSAPKRFEYELKLNEGTRAVADGNSIRLLSKQGGELKIEAPFVVDAAGASSTTAVRWELGTESGGTRKLALVLSAEGLAYPLAIDPTFAVITATMAAARYGHTATLLNNGLVLVVGGQGASGVARLAELYDPISQTWRPAKNSAPPGHIDSRQDHTATLLQNGQVLVVGGDYMSWHYAAMLFDPASETWQYSDTAIPNPPGTYTNTMATPRYSHTATLLPNGAVLIVGGRDWNSAAFLSSVETFTPGSGFKTLAPMNNTRFGHTATLIGTSVLVAGGDGSTTSEVFNGTSWSSGGSMNQIRRGHTSTLMPDGTVVAVAGDSAKKTAEYWDGSWHNTGNSLTNARAASSFTSSLLPNGKLLVAFGDSAGTGEIYDPGTKQFGAPALLTGAVALQQTSATLLPTGKILFAGGQVGIPVSASALYDSSFGNDSATFTGNTSTGSHDSAQLVNLPNGNVLLTPGAGTQSEEYSGSSWGTPRSMGGSATTDGGSATLLPNGKVLCVPYLGSNAQLYDPGSHVWSYTAGQFVARYPDHSQSTSVTVVGGAAALLPNGTVLFTGGYAGGFAFDSAELYDPSTDAWTFTAGYMTTVREAHTATLLNNGKVLIAGGTDYYVYYNSCELYDPATGTFSPTGSMSTPRGSHTATLLANGKVLVVGGKDLGASALQNSELYDPASGTWTGTATTAQKRAGHTATMLQNGLVLVAGGSASSTTIEIYDPASNTWTASAKALGAGRSDHVATLLNSGAVLLVGGDGGKSAELYDVGLAYQPGWRPSLSAFLSSLPLGSNLLAGGSAFLGISEGSSGGNSSNSATNTPLLQLSSLVNGQTAFLMPDPATGWNNSSFTTSPVIGFVPGPAQVTVITNGIPSISQVIQLTNDPHAISTVNTPSPATVNTSFSSSLVANVKNAQNGGTVPQPQNVPFVSVTFQIMVGSNGASATFTGGPTAATALADANGMVSSPTLTANSVAGSFTVTATVVNTSVTTTFNLANAAAIPATVSIFAGSGQSTQVGNDFPAPLQAKVTDLYNNPVPSVTVFFRAPSTGPSGAFSGGVATTTAVTNPSGIAVSSTLTANRVAGSYQVSASAVGVGTAASFPLTNDPGPATKLVVGGLPTPRVAGAAGTIQVVAQDAFGNIATGYSGAVQFQILQGAADISGTAQLPPNYTFQPSDQGQQSFSLTLDKAGAGQTVAVFDTGTPSINGTQTVTVRPAAAAAFSVSDFPDNIAGSDGPLKVTALDPYGNTATGYAGTVTFSSSDPQATLPGNTGLTNGTGTFWPILVTAGTQWIRATDTVNSNITGVQNGITISPYVASSFAVSGFPSPSTAGQASTISVTALDPWENVATGYTGTVALGSSDTTASFLPASSTLLDGVGFFDATLYESGSQTITATDTVDVNLSGDQTVLIAPAAAVSLTVSGYSAVVAGQAGTFTVTAKDSFGNIAKGYTGTVAFTAPSDPQAILPADYTFVPGNAGVHTFGGTTLRTSGNQALTATDIVTSSITGTEQLVISAANAVRFSVSGFPSPVAAGTAATITVSAQDAFGNTADGYRGTVAILSSDQHATLPVNPAFQAADNGTRTFSVTLATAGTQSIIAADTLTPGIRGTQSQITVNAGPFTALQLVAPSLANVGSPFNITVNAVDACGNLVNTVTDNVGIATSDQNAAPPLPESLVGGSRSFGMTLYTTGPQSITASNLTDNSKTPATAALTVNVGAPARLLVLLPGESTAPGTPTGKTGIPSQQVAGTPFTVTVYAVDAGNNPVNSTDSVALACSDLGALLPSPQLLAGGTVVLTVTLTTAATQTISAADATNPGVPPNTSSFLTVMPGSLAGFLVSGFPSPVTQGVAGSFKVSAADAYGNIVSGYLGTVHLASSDPAAVLPADYAFVAADESTHTFAATLNTVPSESITASDVSAPAVTGTQANITVSALAPALSSLSPNAAALNASALTLAVTGKNFLAGSVVQWNGSTRPTTFVSPTQLSAAIPASDLQVQGRAAVTVFTPAPGGGVSNSGVFFVYSGSAVGTWVVTNTHDSGPGSLRFALAQHQSGDSITFDPVLFDLSNADAATLINVFSALPTLSNSNVTIDAADRRVTVNGSAAASADGLLITSNGNAVMGLSIVGFPGSGISIRNGAQNNVIGGSRVLGSGRNGQGLRLSNNGNFGIEITGAGSRNNVVKGCWIGLDASGTNAEPNVAGVIVSGGASSNTIGGTGLGEANVISGNTFEGVTFTGDGTNDNVLIGNSVGLPAVTVSTRQTGQELFAQTKLGNGAAGVFLTKGTQRSRIGGSGDGQGNVVGFNGGNGIEVRAAASRKNSMSSNRIAKNVKGGIALYDGSNAGVTAPAFTMVQRLASHASAYGMRSVASVRIGGTAASDGMVQVFTDAGEQGGTLAGSANVSNGAWQLDADVSGLENITATFTDVDGNTSPFALFGLPPGDTTPDGDADGDGVSNSLEALAGTDPNDPASSPTKQGVVVVDKLGVTLNFAVAAKDAMKATLRLILPDGYSNKGSSAAVQLGDYVEKFARLDNSGSSLKGSATLRILGASATPGLATIGLLQFSVAKKDLQTSLASSGMTNQTTTGKSGVPLSLPVAVALGTGDGKKYVYVGSANVLYKAVQKKAGKAAKTK